MLRQLERGIGLSRVLLFCSDEDLNSGRFQRGNMYQFKAISGKLDELAEQLNLHAIKTGCKEKNRPICYPIRVIKKRRPNLVIILTEKKYLHRVRIGSQPENMFEWHKETKCY
ncbi:hypothetical protein LCGC14_0547380 [marine sediment metagenome]|uniref:Uncharacterized protein n=1 Tax=marine sediment metagenome TaxID=412755 RepID=A0A0F9UCF2_9ZZZZ